MFATYTLTFADGSSVTHDIVETSHEVAARFDAEINFNGMTLSLSCHTLEAFHAMLDDALGV